jgi:hypothetical protein
VGQLQQGPGQRSRGRHLRRLQLNVVLSPAAM